jgi:hypothetical protein
VYDFLFDYYSCRPAHLERWSPGVNVWLENASHTEFPESWPMEERDGGLVLTSPSLPGERLPGWLWITQLLTQTENRPAQLGCYGLHEWAMVYRSSEVRHAAQPLRLAPAALADFVESQALVCSHFDAFRFFTSGARPLNRLQLTRDTQHEMDQPGCLHANMDLYKWAYKASPWVPSELVADCFQLALKIRELDMRASPYDLRELGFEPVAIETEAGRETYAAAQAGFAEEAKPLRAKLREIYLRVGQASRLSQESLEQEDNVNG